MIEVVVGLLRNAEDEVLMTYRAANGLRPNMWEFPGGVVNHGESLKGALGREMFEELSEPVTVVTGVLDMRTITFENGPARISLFGCRFTRGEDARPRPVVAQELRYWTMEYAIRHLPLVPSCYLFYPVVRDLLKVRQ